MTSSANALEQLINQFSQPLAFLRELIQNSLDASTSLIEVSVGFDDDSDCCFVRVADNGHGMDRNIIDSRLTKLFASTKEDDFTKIGKFGIGFVSIFAIKPELVVLETGQHGEAWRILFLPDRSFERRELEEPVEGTSVTVFVPRKKSELQNLRKECLETVVYWCKHSEVEILFNGEPINQSFDLPDVSYQFRLKTDSTETVVSPTEKEDGFQGYYNRGLTLLEGVGSPHAHLSFKLRSRYLEHTLSRDNIRRDEGYEKAMSVVVEAAYEKMPLDLFQQLKERNEEHLWKAARTVLRMDPTLLKKVQKVPVLRARQGKVPLGDLSKTVFYGSEVDSLWEDVEAAGHIVLLVPEPHGDQCLEFLRDSGHSIGSIQMEFFQYRVAEPDKTEASLLAMLKKATRQFLASPFLVDGLNTPTWWGKRFCSFLNPNQRIEQTTNQTKGWRDAIGIRRAHPFWPKLLQLYALQPELAVSMLVRMVNLELDVYRKGEGKLFQSLVKSLKARSAE
jgi:histidine kinase/DNA gyrase B/HSP90-like ATPase